MKLVKKILCCALALSGLTAAGVASAGPAVMVTFKNLSTTAEAKNVIITTNEVATNANASPKPALTVGRLLNNTYGVTSTISPDVNYAALRYTMGTKTCVFYTAFVNTYGSGGFKVPTWSKSATPSGGATCTATITSVNLATYEWAVQFTMK